MRAVWVGLVGAVLSVSAVAAAPRSCPADRATVRVEDTGVRYASQPVERTDLIGKTFKVHRYTEHRRMYFSEPRGVMMNVGYEGYELKGAAGTFVVRRDHVDGTPAIAPVSWTDGPSPYRSKIAWGEGHPKTVKVGGSLDYVLGGPFTSLTLRVIACR